MIGIGYDIHKLVPGRRLIVGGVLIDEDIGALAHSDGDVLLHSLCDALLGAAQLGDIGEHFPETDSRYKNISSLLFLSQTIAMIEKKGLKIINIDATIILEKPKIAVFKNEMKSNISKVCKITNEIINIKATTNEGMGLIGSGGAIAAICVCEVEATNSR